MFEAEFRLEQLTEPPHAERLGGVVAARDEVRAALRASAMTCSAGSPVRNASSPFAIASPKLDAAAPETMPTLCTVSGPVSQTNGSWPKA